MKKKKKSYWFSPMREELRHFYKYKRVLQSTIVENFFQPIITQNKKFELIKVFKSYL